MIVRLASKIKPRVADLTGQQLQEDASHKVAYQQWKSFRDHALKAMRARFGNAAKSGRKMLKVPKGKLPADADLVVTLGFKQGIGFYLTDSSQFSLIRPTNSGLGVLYS